MFLSGYYVHLNGVMNKYIFWIILAWHEWEPGYLQSSDFTESNSRS